MAGTIGQQLKEARLRQGLSVEDVVYATKIPASGVEAMERDDFSAFPNGTYGRAFLSLYSRHLRVDASAVLAQMSRPKNGRRSRPEFLQTDLELTPSEYTIPIVKHRVIELKPKRSFVGFAFFLVLALVIPAVFYAGKWVGLREGIRKESPVEKAVPVISDQGTGIPQDARPPLRARVLAPPPKQQPGTSG